MSRLTPPPSRVGALRLKLVTTCASFILAGLVVLSGKLHADELLIIPERSKGIPALADNRLAEKAGITLGSKGRLWAVQQGRQTDHTLICMNQTQSALQLINSSQSQPWLQLANGGDCQSPQPGLHVCTDSSGQPALMCRSQQVAKTFAGGAVTDMTAVALRSIDNSDEAFFNVANQIMAQHQLHFDLCQDLHGKHGKGGVSFTIQADGLIEDVQVVASGELATPPESMEYADCMAQAIALWQFPNLDYIYEMEYAFVN